jgi:hypothetical protein
MADQPGTTSHHGARPEHRPVASTVTYEIDDANGKAVGSYITLATAW